MLQITNPNLIYHNFSTEYIFCLAMLLRSALSQQRICRPPLSFDSIFMNDAQCAESNEKSIFWFLFSELSWKFIEMVLNHFPPYAERCMCLKDKRWEKFQFVRMPSNELLKDSFELNLKDLKLVELKLIWNVITLLGFIWHQIEFHLEPN